MAAFTFTSNALEYKYEIYNNDAHGGHAGAISGLLIGDYGTNTKWDTDAGVGGLADYTIKYYVKVNDAADKVVNVIYDETNADHGHYAESVEEDGITKIYAIDETTGEITFASDGTAVTETIDGSTINLETIDVTLGFDSTTGGESLFNNFSTATFTAGSDFTTGVSYDFDTASDSVRFTGAVLDEIESGPGVDSTDGWTELFTLGNVTINNNAVIEDLLDSTFADTLTAEQGQLNLSAVTNIYDTVVSDRTGANTADILSLQEAGVTTAEETNNIDTSTAANQVTLHEAKSQFEDFGTNIYTQRNIGSSETTFLVRKGSTVNAESFWTNVGTYSEMLNEVKLDAVASSEISLKSGLDGTAVSTYLSSNTNTTLNLVDGFETQLSTIDGDEFNTTTSDKFKLDFEVTINNSLTAGTALSDLDFYKLSGMNNDTTNGTNDDSKVTKNIVTFQGDLNYDGRVSLKDLAFLNAGKIAEDDSNDFDDVDANFDNTIDVDDLTVLSSEWNQTIHDSVTKTDLLSSGDSRYTTWTHIDSEVVNEKAATANLAFADINTSVTYANSSFDHQSDVEAAHTALVGGLDGGFISIADMVSGL